MNCQEQWCVASFVHDCLFGLVAGSSCILRIVDGWLNMFYLLRQLFFNRSSHT